MSADESEHAETDAADETETGEQSGQRVRLDDGVAVALGKGNRGKLRLTVYANADTPDIRELGTKDVSADFFERYDNERGEVKNYILGLVEDQCDDDVSKAAVEAGFERLCQKLEDTSTIDREELQSPTVRKLLDETESVTAETGDEDATMTIKLLGDDGHTATCKFGPGEWPANDSSGIIEQAYFVAHPGGDILDLSADEWRALRDEWNSRVGPENVTRNEVGEIDEIAAELIRVLKQRIRATEEYDDLRNDPKIALYDRNNEDRSDSQIHKNHGDVDVLWIQTGAINEALDDIPGATSGRDTKSPLATKLREDDTVLRGSKGFSRGGTRIPVWAFDPEPLGGLDLLGDDEDEDVDEDRGVSI